MADNSSLPQLRRRAGLTQASLAQRIGKSASLIAKIEEDRRRPSVDTLAAIAQTLALTGSEQCRLYLAYGYVPPGGSTLQRIEAVLSLDDALPPGQAERILTLVRAAYQVATE